MRKITLLLFVVCSAVGTIIAQNTGLNQATSVTQAADLRLNDNSSSTGVVQDSGIAGTRGGITYYADRASLTADCTGTLVLEDFSNGPGVISGCDGDFSDAGNSCYAAGEIESGIVITSSDTTPAEYTVYAPAGFDINVNDMVGANQFTSFTIINFPNGDVNAVALDLHGLFASASIDVRLMGAGGLLDTVTITTGLPGPVFFGFISPEPILSIEFEDLTGANAELVAQVEFGTCGGSTTLPTDDCGAFTSSPGTAIDSANPTTVDVITFPAGSGNVGDLNVAIGITHTFLADLEISLMSPAGTIVDLFFDNCGGDDDMNVMFDDEGVVLACDTPTVGVFIPDNALSAFDGEALEGDWTLSVTDDAGGDTGTLDTWCLIPTLQLPTDACGAFTSSPGSGIDSANPTTTDIITVGAGDAGTISDLNVAIDISHTFLADLEITLTSPDGTSVDLFFDNCGGDDDMVVMFDDEGEVLVCGTPTMGIFIPDNALSAFDGEEFEGDWTLSVTDDAGGDVGTLNSWCLVAETTVSLNDLETVGFEYFPNPVNDNLTLRANENITSVSIVNLLGQEVKSINPSAIEAVIDMSNLEAGTYFVRAQVNEKTGTFKVVKK